MGWRVSVSCIKLLTPANIVLDQQLDAERELTMVPNPVQMIPGKSPPRSRNKPPCRILTAYFAGLEKDLAVTLFSTHNLMRNGS